MFLYIHVTTVVVCVTRDPHTDVKAAQELAFFSLTKRTAPVPARKCDLYTYNKSKHDQKEGCFMIAPPNSRGAYWLYALLVQCSPLL